MIFFFFDRLKMCVKNPYFRSCSFFAATSIGEALCQSSVKIFFKWRQHDFHWKLFTEIIDVSIVITSILPNNTFIIFLSKSFYQSHTGYYESGQTALDWLVEAHNRQVVFLVHTCFLRRPSWNVAWSTHVPSSPWWREATPTTWSSSSQTLAKYTWMGQ